MTDQLDTDIRALMRAVVESSIEPPAFPAEQIAVRRATGDYETPGGWVDERPVMERVAQSQQPSGDGWRRSKWTVGLATAVIVLVLGAIPLLLLASDESDRNEPAASPDQILGEWELVEINGEPGLLSYDGKAVSVTFSLDPDFAPRTTNAAGETRPREFSFSAFTGCNGGSGRWTTEGDQLLLGGMTSTLVGCGPSPFDPETSALGDQEYRLQGCVLTGVATWAVSGDQLTITKDDLGSIDTCPEDGSLVAVFQRPDVSTESSAKDTIYGVWEVIELDGAAPMGRPGVTFSVVPELNASLNSAEPGQAGPGLAGPHFSASGGCNRTGGTYTVEGDRVIANPSGITLIGCSDEVSQQEALFIGLVAAANWSIADGFLTLTGDLGTVAVLSQVDTTPAVGVWQLAELDGKPPTSDISVDLSETGSINGYAGCFILGTYLVEGDQLTINTTPPVEQQQPPPPEMICDGASDEQLQLLSLLREGRGTATGDELRFISDSGATAVFHRA